jgi:hypothetical protein
VVETATVTGGLATAKRLIELLEQDRFLLDAAVWVPNEEGYGRVYLVPRDRSESHLKQMIRVAETISHHKDELPDRHELRYSVVEPDDPVIKAVTAVSRSPGKVQGVYRDGTYIDTAYLLRTAA